MPEDTSFETTPDVPAVPTGPNSTTTTTESKTVTSEKVRRESHILQVSVRGWLTLMVMVTVCYMSVFGIEIAEPLYTLAGMVVSYYFGQKQNQKP